MNDKIEYVLKRCFDKDIKELVFSKYLDDIGDYIDKDHKSYLKNAKAIDDFIWIDSVSNKIKQSAFNKYYCFENLFNFKEFLIREFSEFSIFSNKLIKGEWEFCINETPVWMDWKPTYKKESYDSFAYNLTNCMIYYKGYDEGKKKLRELGIPVEFGGTVADYIRANLISFKPLALEVIEYLKRLPSPN